MGLFKPISQEKQQKKDALAAQKADRKASFDRGRADATAGYAELKETNAAKWQASNAALSARTAESKASQKQVRRDANARYAQSMDALTRETRAGKEPPRRNPDNPAQV
jgi:hypothetical protein